MFKNTDGGGTLTFEAADVTGSNTVVVSDVEKTTPAGAIANALAASMSLPSNVAWALRENNSATYLDDATPIGEQIGPDATLTVSPRSHLGGTS